MPKPVVVSSFRRNSFHGLEDAAQTFEIGDFLTLDVTTGEVRECANTDTVFWGIAEGDASTVTGTAAVVHELFPGDILQLDIWSLHTGALVDASTLVDGQVCGVALVSGEWYAETQNTGATTAILNAVAFIKPQGDLRDELTDQTIYRGLFRVLEAVCGTVVGAA